MRPRTASDTSPEASPRYSIWPNSFKEKDTDPTHVLYVEAPLKKDGEDDSKGDRSISEERLISSNDHLAPGNWGLLIGMAY